MVRGPSEYRFFSVSVGFSHNKRVVTSQPVDFFAIGLRIRNPRGKPVLKTFLRQGVSNIGGSSGRRTEMAFVQNSTPSSGF